MNMQEENQRQVKLIRTITTEGKLNKTKSQPDDVNNDQAVMRSLLQTVITADELATRKSLLTCAELALETSCF